MIKQLETSEKWTSLIIQGPVHGTRVSEKLSNFYLILLSWYLHFQVAWIKYWYEIYFIFFYSCLN